MILYPVLLALGDEHVHPVSTIWSAICLSGPATRTDAQQCANRQNAMDLALRLMQLPGQTRDFPWIRDADGSILSPAYQRGYAKAMGR